MNAGVGTSPWAVRSTPARAAPSVAVTLNAAFIDAHVPAVDHEVAAVLEAQLLVVAANARIVAKTVEAEEGPPGSGGVSVGPVDDRAADALPGTRPPHRELVDVGGVGRALAPVDRVVP